MWYCEILISNGNYEYFFKRNHSLCLNMFTGKKIPKSIPYELRLSSTEIWDFEIYQCEDLFIQAVARFHYQESLVATGQLSIRYLQHGVFSLINVS